MRVARSVDAVVPPLPLVLGTSKEKQAYQRELHTVTVGVRVESLAKQQLHGEQLESLG